MCSCHFTDGISVSGPLRLVLCFLTSFVTWFVLPVLLQDWFLSEEQTVVGYTVVLAAYLNKSRNCFKLFDERSMLTGRQDHES